MSHYNAEDYIEIEIVYKPKKDYIEGNPRGKEIKMFDSIFIENNKEKCKIVYNDKEYELKEYFEDICANYNYKDEINIKLELSKDIIDMSYMFNECETIIFVKDISKSKCTNTIYFNSTISESDTNSTDEFELNVRDESETNNLANDLFNEYHKLSSSIQAIPIKNISNISEINNTFYNENIETLLNFHKVTNMSHMFDGCESLLSISNISNWNTDKVTDMSSMFTGCEKLISLSDISSWNTSNVINMSHMFDGCISLISLPDISSWKTSNVNDMSYMFNECNSLISLPDISKWDTFSLNNLSFMFGLCNSLKSLPTSQNGILWLIIIIILV